MISISKFLKATTANMKFNTFLLIFVVGSSCLVAASANNVLHSNPIATDHDSKFTANDVDEVNSADMERFGASWFIIKLFVQRALNFVKGLLCTEREISAINAAAIKFVSEIDQCDENDKNNVEIKRLVESCQNIISIGNDISYINEKFCSGIKNIEESENSETPPKCFELLYKRTLDLKDTIYDAIIKSPSEAGECVNTAVANMKKVFQRFPDKTYLCSLLNGKLP